MLNLQLVLTTIGTLLL